jgi:MraZ protein
MALFIGEFRRRMDAKNRLRIPAALRQAVDRDGDGGRFFLVLGPHRELCLYPERLFRRLVESLDRAPQDHDERFDVLFGLARLARVDGRGRLVIPGTLLARAGLTRDVVLLGVCDHIEVWPAQRWRQHCHALGRSGWGMEPPVEAS